MKILFKLGILFVGLTFLYYYFADNKAKKNLKEELLKLKTDSIFNSKLDSLHNLKESDVIKKSDSLYRLFKTDNDNQTEVQL